MSLKILEKKIESKSEKSMCEDDIFINENYLAVLDGVTSKNNLTFNNLTSGQIANKLVKDVLESLPSDASVDNFLSEVYRIFTCFYKDKKIYNNVKREKYKRCQTNIVIYQIKTKTIWCIGDAQILIGKKKYINLSKKIDIVLSEVRSMINQNELDKGISTDQILKNDTGREKILDIIKIGVNFSNTNNKEYGYPVVDGFEIPKKLIKKIELNDFYGEIVLATDGYPKLFPTLEESEVYLKEYLENDPLLIGEFKETKGLEINNNSFDDRAYLRFIVD